MNSKASYREYFSTLYSYVKLTVILREHGEPHQNLSKFIQGSQYDHYLSLEKCEMYESWFKEKLSNIT